MAKVVYGFKDKAAAQRAAQYFGRNPQDQKQQALYSEAAQTRIRIVEVPDGIDGYGHATDDVQFPTSDVEIVRTTTNPQSLLSETSETFHAIQAAPLEPTNYPAEARVVAVTDTFNQTFLLTPTPSEVFGTIQGWNGTNFNDPEVVTLEDGFTVNGDTTLYAYPAPTLTDALDAGAVVSCRYIKSVGKWFFFKPTGGGGKVLNVYGPALAVQETTGVSPVFYSEFAAGEEVAGLSITAISQMQNATGSATSGVCVTFPTTFSTPDELVRWWIDGSGLSPYLGGMYEYIDSNSDYAISPAEYYGKVISDGSHYYFPRYRTINGQRYWVCPGLVNYEYIYYTSKDGVSGWAIGQTLGKFLTSGDTEPFSSSGLSDLMTQEGLTYSKPAWTSSVQFGIYSANADAAALFPAVPSIQFGCGRWVASDGRTGITPFYFTHVCDGTAKQWNGTYTCQAFGKRFSGIGYTTTGGSSFYHIGSADSEAGFYKATSAPSTSSPVTFSYTPGTHPLQGTLSLTHHGEVVDTWTMKLSTGVVATYECAQGATSMTLASADNSRYFFRTISQQGNYWVAAGVDATVGALIFDGATLDAESGNDFIFDHDITLTFDQYVQGTEKKKVWVCSPGVIS